MSQQPLLLFICQGNICRSPLAETHARRRLQREGRDQHIAVGSAGLIAWPGSPAAQEMIEVAAAMGLDLNNHRARKLSAYLLDESELVVAMTRAQQTLLADAYPEFASRVTLLGELAAGGEDVEDPYRRGRASYQRCADTLIALLDAAWPTILQRLAHVGEV